MRALLLAVSAMFVFACSPPPATCSAATCAGCCDSSNTCQTGTDDTACGGSALACTACGAGFSCQAKTCLRSATGGGGGGDAGTGGGTGGGATGGGAGGGATGGGTGGGATGGGGGTVNCQSMSPPTIPITFPQTCPTPTACGGNPSGTFFYTAACIGMTEFDPMIARIEQGCGVGNVRITSVDGGMAGYATFTGGANVCRVVTGGVTVSATITGVCANATACGFLASGISQGGYTGACGIDAGACDCVATKAIDINNMGVAYTVGATTLTLTNSGKQYSTCLSGTTFTTLEVDAGSTPHEPGTATLTHQ